MQFFKRWGFAGLTLVLAAGWSCREVGFAQDRSRQVASGTINLDQVHMVTATDKGSLVVGLVGRCNPNEICLAGRQGRAVARCCIHTTS